MKIWVDADACPGAIKSILYRAAERSGCDLILVANKSLHVPRSPRIRSVRVGHGFDVADRHIAEQVEPGDIVVTADIPLAADVLARGAHALHPQGERFSDENIAERLAVRDLMSDLRDAGMVGGGPPPFGTKQRQDFANQLDRLLKPGA